MPRGRSLQKDKMHMKESHGAQQSGHVVDVDTFTYDNNVSTEETPLFIPWITKNNKHAGIKGREASILEVAFSEIAHLLIKPGLTPPAYLVEENGQVVCVASENYNEHIKREMEKNKTCYTFSPDLWSFELVKTITSYPLDMPDIPLDDIPLDDIPLDDIPLDDIPLDERQLEFQTKQKIEQLEILSQKMPELGMIDKNILQKIMQLSEASKAVNFLNKMPSDFFHTLMSKHNRDEVVVDMDSLASVLTASYTLEEDDLHKGNIGFYVTDYTDKEGNKVLDKNGEPKKQFNFFKIDHDLMFTNSIMSQRDMRLANLFYNKDSFKITTRDLDDFPDLKDSGNHYWPTKKRLFAIGDKAYTSDKDREAFANLKNDKEFKNSKWKYFLKAAVMPVDLIEKSINSHLDAEKDLDKITMIENSIYYRLGKLRERMVESKQFRDYLTDKGDDAFKELEKEFNEYMKNPDLNISDQDKELLLQELTTNFDSIKTCAKNINKLSPMQRAIRFGSYNFSPNNKSTKEDIEEAVEQFNKIESNDPRKYAAACVAIDVIQKSNSSEEYKENFISYNKAKEAYLNPSEIETFKQFEAAAMKIRACKLPLKQQKKEIFGLLKLTTLPINELKLLKSELLKKEPNSKVLKYINQLRSDSWLIRKILKAYGKTTTSSLMIDEIDKQMANKGAKFTISYREQLAKNRSKIPAPGLDINSTSKLNLDLKK